MSLSYSYPFYFGLVPLILFRISGFCVYCLIFDFQGSSLIFLSERRRRDLNPRTVISGLLPFQGSLFNHLSTSACVPVPESTIHSVFCRSLSRQLIHNTFMAIKSQPLFSLFLTAQSGEDGIRTHVPRRANGFQDRLVMAASIPLPCFMP